MGVAVTTHIKHLSAHLVNTFEWRMLASDTDLSAACLKERKEAMIADCSLVGR